VSYHLSSDFATSERAAKNLTATDWCYVVVWLSGMRGKFNPVQQNFVMRDGKSI
jgi:hypothetical protein